MADKTRIGLVGCGAIAGAYLPMLKNFPFLEVAACADLNIEAAKKRAQEFGVPKVHNTVDDLMKDDLIDAVLNLTIPKAHVPVAMQAIENGKHTFAEKPFAINRDEGKQLLAAAKKAKKKVGCAPDTFMGAGVQTARAEIEKGTIGKPVAFTAFMMCRGHEHWHPSPEFYYQPGGGPMFDMGPYYITALLNLLGPITRVTGMAKIAVPDRTITSEPLKGKKIDVQTYDHIAGSMEFESGVMGTMVQSFATRFCELGGKHPITIYGTDGTMKVPDPNTFDGTVLVRTTNDQDWREVPHATPKGYGRGVGIADMIASIQHKREFRSTGQQAFAVLDIMQGFIDSAESGKVYKVKAKYERPPMMRADLPFGQLD
jgi:predicted dehydrogenase